MSLGVLFVRLFVLLRSLQRAQRGGVSDSGRVDGLVGDSRHALLVYVAIDSEINRARPRAPAFQLAVVFCLACWLLLCRYSHHHPQPPIT